MNIKNSLKNIFNNVVGNLAVIGPHFGIEAELLLAGKKPLGWLGSGVYPDELVFDDPALQAEHEGRKKLDEAVRQGKLKSMDIIVHKARVNPYDVDSEFQELSKPEIVRHYCQPGKEKDMETMVAYNEKAFNGEEPPVDLLQKDIGTYLGYRDKDVKLWQNGRWPRKLLRAAFPYVPSDRLRKKTVSVLNKVDEKWSGLIQPRANATYRQKILYQIEKEQKRARKKPGA